MIKNIKKSTLLDLTEEVTYQDGQGVSKTLSQNENISLTLFSFAEGEEISSHKSSGDALVQILDGEARITIDSVEFFLKKGESIVMPAQVSHALFAVKPFKMLLTVIFASGQ